MGQYIPLYVFGLLKSAALRPGHDLSSDKRMATWCRLSTLSVDKAAAFFVPRLVAVHNLQDHEGVVDANGIITLPDKLGLSSQSLSPSGAYLIENGHSMVLFIGQDIDPAWLQDMFGVSNLNDIPQDGKVYEEELLQPGSALKERFLNIVEAIRREVDVPYMALSVTCQGRTDVPVRKFWDLIIEDKGAGMNVSYQEFEARLKSHGVPSMMAGARGPGPQ